MKVTYFILLILFLHSSFSFSNTSDTDLYVSKLQQIQSAKIDHNNLLAVDAHDDSLFGESIDLYSGTVVFKRNDAVIPGNSSLTVSYPTFYKTYMPDFEGWQEDIPRIEVFYAEDGQNHSLPLGWEQGKYCTGSMQKQTEGIPEWISRAFHSVPTIIIPGVGTESLLNNNGQIGKSASEVKYVTKRNWIITCYNKGSREGLKVTLPNGNSYYFDEGNDERPQKKIYMESGSLGDYNSIYFKGYKALYLTKVEDRFDNYLSYSYSKKGLKSIIGSDGREIHVNYSGDVKRVSASSKNNSNEKRTWRYNKDASVVTQPDGRKWKYNLFYIDAWPNDLVEAGGAPDNACILHPQFNGVMKVNHPDGAIGEFYLREEYQNKANYYNYGLPPICSKAYSIYKKKIKNGSDYLEWNYTYSGTAQSYIRQHHIRDEYKLSGNVPTNVDRHLTKTTTVTRPDGSKEKFFINRDYSSYLEGQVIAKELYDLNGRLKHTIESYYRKSKELGSKVTSRISGNYSTFNSYGVLISNKIKSDGNIYNTDLTDFNIYEMPQKIIESNSFGMKRVISKTFIHDKESWVLNLPNKVSLSSDGINFENLRETKYKYYLEANNQKLPSKEYRFGKLIDSYVSYYSDGNIKRIQLEKNLPFAVANEKQKKHFIEFGSYKSGVPTSVSVAKPKSSEVMSIKKEVNNFGLVTKYTDFNNVSTSYTYDKIGRIKSIDLTNDSTFGNWQDTQFVWDDKTNTRTIQRCTLNANRTACTDDVSFETVEKYDSLLRLKSTTLNDKVNNITRYQNFAYDYRNLPTFTSQVSDSSTESKGVTTVYDPLGRKEKVSTSGLGFVTYEYLSGNRIRVTDAGKNTSNKRDSTTTTYQAFGSPSYDVATKIESPEGLTTEMNIDVFGLVHSITQTGHGKFVTKFTETRKYDANKQLCLIQRPDIGNTLFKHNVLGQVIWQKQGVSNTACVTTKPVNSTTLAYNNLGDLHSITYPDSTSNLTYGYDNNGNLLSIKSGDVEHVYNYNNQNLLEDELLYIDSNNALSIDYEYNALQHRKSITYPDGTYVNFAPNSFGEATQAIYKVGSEVHQVFAKDAVYYPSGQIDSFTYGNGVTHKTELDRTSLLPSSITDKRNSTNLVNLSYSYDNNMNVTSIKNGVQSAYSLTNLTYDGLDRLISTSGGTGIGDSSITYDAIGNIETYTSKGRNLFYTYDGTTNRLTRVAGITGKYGSIAYDSRGNVTNNGSFDLSYNLANQMKSANGNSYFYDGHNRRVKKTNSDGHAEYSMYSKDGTLLYREKGSASGNGTNYIYLGKKLVAKYGDVTPQTLAESRQHYRPFGETINESRDDIGYTGHKFDKDINLSYMQARYYDPVIGRFYSNDPVGWTPKNPVMSFNRYLYVNNNPYKYTDPNGEFLWHAVGAALGGGLNALAQGVTKGFDNIDYTQVGVAAAVGAAGVGFAGSIGAITTSAGLSGASAVVANTAGNAVAGAALGTAGTLANAAIDGLQGDTDGSLTTGQVAQGAKDGFVFGALGTVAGASATKIVTTATGDLLGSSGQITKVGVGISESAGNSVANSADVKNAVIDIAKEKLE